MRTTLLLFYSFALPLSGYTADFAQQSEFESIAAFVSAAKAFRPTQTRTDLTDIFTMPELGQPDDPRTVTPVIPERLDLCDVLWAGESQALVFANAKPKTHATNCAVGVLFLLSRTNDRWTIADSLRFTAAGKYADVVAQLTAWVGTGYRLETDGMRPVVTIQESHGSRGYGDRASASYAVEGKKLKRVELE